MVSAIVKSVGIYPKMALELRSAEMKRTECWYISENGIGTYERGDLQDVQITNEYKIQIQITRWKIANTYNIATINAEFMFCIGLLNENGCPALLYQSSQSISLHSRLRCPMSNCPVSFLYPHWDHLTPWRHSGLWHAIRHLWAPCAVIAAPCLGGPLARHSSVTPGSGHRGAL